MSETRSGSQRNAPAVLQHAEWHALSGWGESVHALARVHRPRDEESVAAILAAARSAGVSLALRGAGRSYGDASLPGVRDVLDLSRLRGIRSFDADAGRITVEPGATVEDVWRHVVAHGWWPAVVPGTMRPTIGGCVAMNVHGKNQYRVGATGEHVERLTLLSPTGERHDVTHAHTPDLFRAVIGGAGLLGVVTEITLRLHRIHSDELEVTAEPTRSLEEMLDVLDARRAESEYLVGWVDAFDRRARGVVHSARHLREGEGGSSVGASSQDLPPRLLGVVPRDRAALLMQVFGRPLGIHALNMAKYTVGRLRGRHTFRQSHAAFHFLLDYIPGWKSIYAPGGLLQHQTFVPRDAAAEVFRSHLARCRTLDLRPWLAVVKRHRPDEFLLTHNLDGMSLALDFPVTAANAERLTALCHAMDEDTVAAGGKVYLAKDQTARAETFAAATPGLPAFRDWRRRLDPEGTLVSAQARRLGIV